MRKRLFRAAIVAVLGIATLTYGQLEKHVTVSIEGKPVRVQTFAATVGEAIQRAGVDLGPKDRVEPPVAAPLTDGLVIDVYRAKEITLLLDGKPRRVVVTGLTIEDVLKEIDLRGRMADLVRPSRGSPVREGMTIDYRRALDVNVRHDEKTERVITNAATVGAVVKELGIKLGARDRIEPAPTTKPRSGMTIRVLRVGIKTETRTITTAYSTVLRRDRNLEVGVRKVVQEGRTGIKRVTYRSRYVDGRRVSRTVVSTKVIRTTRSRIIAIGSGYPGCACDRGTQTGGASWYSQADGLTAAHRTLPFGTIVRVENLENGKYINVRIADRGPFIKGRIIDLSDEAFRRIASLSQGVVRVRIRW